MSNGPCAHPDGKRVLLANSEIHEVYEFRRGPDGRLAQRASFCEWEPAWGIPDGIACDVAGGVWIAHWGGHRVSRFEADGAFDRAWDVPALNVTKPAFGGPDLRDVYLTTASRGLRAAPGAGALYRLRAPHPGHPARTFEWRGPAGTHAR